MNREIAKGDTYAYTETMSLEDFGTYWFAKFVGIMLLDDWGATVDACLARLAESINIEKDWERECLGSFYIKPNYPGRSSHVCNGTFLVTDGQRNRGVGRLMGEGYLEWAPKLSYTYSVFDLVYETNVASCKIWDALGFKRVGRIKGCGHLKNYEEPIDAIIYGRELSTNSPDDAIAEERFDRIKYYLKHQKYPDGIGRAEKSRLRSAATHYKLVPDPSGIEEEKLFLRNKEVIADPQKQYEIAREFHRRSHEGINKTTAQVNDKYHWLRIKETATLVIKNCPECGETLKRAPAPPAPNQQQTVIESSHVQQTSDDIQRTNDLQASNEMQMIMSEMADAQFTSDMASMAQNTSLMTHMPTPATMSTQPSLNMNQQTPLGQLGQQGPLGHLGQQSQYGQQSDPHMQHQQQQPMVMSGADLPQLMGYEMTPVDPRLMAQLQGYEPFMQQTTVDSQMQNANAVPSGELLEDFVPDPAFGGGP